MVDSFITRTEVAEAVAACQAANRRAGLRPVWRAIVERTGKRPSFSTVSRLLTELQAPDPAPAAERAVPPDQVVAQVQQLAPALWQAALIAARKDLADEFRRQAEQLAAAAERERDLLHGAPQPGALFAAILQLAALDGDPRPARPETLRSVWPPQGFMLEARARCRGGWLPWWVLRVLAETLLARLVIARGKPVGAFDPQRYMQEIRSNTDFSKHDRTLCVVLDCALPRIEAIRAHVQACATEQGFEWGMTVSDTALMTCLVTSETEGLHVHFVDGGSGGYTDAARQMKAARAARTAPA